MPELSKDALLRLGARYALYLLYRDQHEQRPMAEVVVSADYCNLWDIMDAGLKGPELNPQVSLNEIIEYVHAQMEGR